MRHTALVRQAFVHQAFLVMAVDADIRAPGAAITVALCGHWDHEPPCTLAPHHSHADRTGRGVRVRTLFVVEPESEIVVRDRIDRALADGQLSGPDGVMTQWQLCGSHPSEVRANEATCAQRLIRS